MFGEDERLVEHRILVWRNGEATPMQLVRVVTHGHVVTHPNGRVVHQSPAGSSQCEAEGELPVHLGALTAQSFVEAHGAYQGKTKGAAHAL